MKIVQTFWSKPFFDTARAKGLQQACGWCNPLHYFMSHALSCLSLRQHYDRVELYTDPAGRRLLVDALQLPYTAVHLLPPEVDDYPADLWAVGKLYAYRAQQEPFLHVDYDAYLWQPFPEAVEQAPLVAQNEERGIAFNRANVMDVLLKACAVPAYMQQMKTTNEANVGIFGGTDTAFIRRYASEALRFAASNRDQMATFRYPYYFSTIVEQYLLTCLAASEGRPITYAFHDVDAHFSQLVRFDRVPSPQWYVHACGPWKREEWVGEAVAYQLYRRFPEAYRHVKEWYEENYPEAAEPFGCSSPSDKVRVAEGSPAPRLSVVVPAWNAEPFIGRCLRSLCGQTYRELEVVVVDDGSTDQTVEVVEKAAARDGRVRLIRQAHRGVAAARNRGLAVIRGELVAFADADDYAHPQYLELMVQALDSHPAADMSMTLSVRTRCRTDASLQQRYARADVTAHDGSVLRRSLFMGYRQISPNQCHTCHGKLFRRALLADLTFPEDYAVYEDALLMNRVSLRVSRFVLVRQRLYFWVQHPWSTLATSASGLLQGPRAYRDCLNAIPRQDAATRSACLQRICLHNIFLLSRHESGTLSGVSAAAVRRAVAIPPGVGLAFWCARHIPLADKWKLWMALHNATSRRRLMATMQATRQQEQERVGAAPAEISGLVSVIVPIYNKVAQQLPACLDSIVAQRYDRLQIVLVDGGTTDGSSDICEDYARKDSRITVVHQVCNSLSEARNAGLRLATGEYVVMVDAGDTLHPQLIYLLHRALQQGDFPVAVARWQTVEQPVTAGTMPQLSSVSQMDMVVQRDLFRSLAGQGALPVDVCVIWGKLYRRRAIGNLRFDDADSEGMLFLTRLYRSVPYVVGVDQPLYFRLQHCLAPGDSPREPVLAHRLRICRQQADMMADTPYAPWFLSFLYRSMAEALAASHHREQSAVVRRTVRAIVRQTARRLLQTARLPLTERLRLLLAVIRRGLC